MSRAYPSALEQGAHEIIFEHQPEGGIASARNAAAERATGDYLLFLDADDELAPGYLDAMISAEHDATRGGFCVCEGVIDQALIAPCLLLTPRVSYMHTRRGRTQQEAARFWREVDLRHGNWLVIGTLVPRALFSELGGFREWPIYEDYDLFARCHKAGARVVKVHDAVYMAHWRVDSRNKSLSEMERRRVHYEIGRDLFPEHYGEAWVARHLRGVARDRG